jgi:transcriptional regulator with XRE-family HTH domain
VTAGKRIREYRRRLGMTQEVLAGRAGVSTSWVSQVERGILSPGSLRSVILVAEALGVDPADLVDVPRRRIRPGEARANGVRDLVTVVRRSRSALAQGATEPDISSIVTRLDRAASFQRSCRYDQAAPLLAALIPEAESAARMLQNTERETEAYRLLACVYRSTIYTLFRSGESDDVAWIAAERCANAAERSEDLVTQAVAAVCRTHLSIHVGWVAEAVEAVMPALDALAPAAEAPDQSPSDDPWWRPEPVAAWGALLLGGAIGAAGGGDRATMHRLLRQAEAAAQRAPRDDGFFGPTDTRVQTVDALAALGDATEVLRLGTALNLSGLPANEHDRPAQLHIDVAIGHEYKRQDEAALYRLLEGERVAPQLIREHPTVREMVSAMVHRRERRSMTPGLRDLAERVGVFDTE